jgi:hypothetical protein
VNFQNIFTLVSLLKNLGGDCVAIEAHAHAFLYYTLLLYHLAKGDHKGGYTMPISQILGK